MGRSCLLVEDDRDIAQMYRLKLEREGWEVAVALDGETGLVMLKQHRPDVILLDVMLPGIDGFEVLEAIRADPDYRGMPVVVVSNSAGTAGKLDRARELGVLDWLTKSSTSPSALTDRLDQLLPNS
jgi:two-component system, OmpR family, alkaline phosphatase synthesis response regulator PhoP